MKIKLLALLFILTSSGCRQKTNLYNYFMENNLTDEFKYYKWSIGDHDFAAHVNALKIDTIDKAKCLTVLVYDMYRKKIAGKQKYVLDNKGMRLIENVILEYDHYWKVRDSTIYQIDSTHNYTFYWRMKKGDKAVLKMFYESDGQKIVTTYTQLLIQKRKMRFNNKPIESWEVKRVGNYKTYQNDTIINETTDERSEFYGRDQGLFLINDLTQDMTLRLKGIYDSFEETWN